MEMKKYYGVIRISRAGNKTMCEKLFDNYDDADTYACNLQLLPYGIDGFSVVEVKYDPNFL